MSSSCCCFCTPTAEKTKRNHLGHPCLPYLYPWVEDAESQQRTEGPLRLLRKFLFKGALVPVWVVIYCNCPIIFFSCGEYIAGWLAELIAFLQRRRQKNWHFWPYCILSFLFRLTPLFTDKWLQCLFAVIVFEINNKCLETPILENYSNIFYSISVSSVQKALLPILHLLIVLGRLNPRTLISKLTTPVSTSHNVVFKKAGVWALTFCGSFLAKKSWFSLEDGLLKQRT